MSALALASEGGAWYAVDRVQDFARGEHRLLEVEGVRVVVFHLDEGYFAIEDACTHDRGELASGRLEGREIVCPRHGARFDVTSGAVTAPPAYEAVATFATRVRDGLVEVRVAGG